MGAVHDCPMTVSQVVAVWETLGEEPFVTVCFTLADICSAMQAQDAHSSLLANSLSSLNLDGTRVSGQGPGDVRG